MIARYASNPEEKEKLLKIATPLHCLQSLLFECSAPNTKDDWMAPGLFISLLKTDSTIYTQLTSPLMKKIYQLYSLDENSSIDWIDDDDSGTSIADGLSAAYAKLMTSANVLSSVSATTIKNVAVIPTSVSRRVIDEDDDEDDKYPHSDVTKGTSPVVPSDRGGAVGGAVGKINAFDDDDDSDNENENEEDDHSDISDTGNAYDDDSWEMGDIGAKLHCQTLKYLVALRLVSGKYTCLQWQI